MAILVITHKQKSLVPGLPYQVLINGQLVGMLSTPQARLNMPAGQYAVTIQAGGFVPIGKKGRGLDLSLSSTATVKVSEGAYTCLDFQNKERWWDILFTIDLFLWLASLFFKLPHPWNIVYHAVSDGFFLIWIIRLIVLRKRYFSLDVYTTVKEPEKIVASK